MKTISLGQKEKMSKFGYKCLNFGEPVNTDVKSSQGTCDKWT